MEQLLDQFLHYLVVEKGLSKNTIEAYSHGLSRFLNNLREKGVEEIRDVGKFHVRGFLLTLEKEKAFHQDHCEKSGCRSYFFSIFDSGRNIGIKSCRGIRITKSSKNAAGNFEFERDRTVIGTT